MAKHHRRHHSYRRRNPLGVSTSDVKDTVVSLVGFAGANYGSSFLGQSGWLDVLATCAIAIGLRMVGGSYGSELFKGGLFAAGLKAIKQTGVAVPGLSSYVPGYFSAPTASDAYGRATPPTIMLPAPAKGGGGMGMGPPAAYARYRSRFVTRF